MQTSKVCVTQSVSGTNAVHISTGLERLIVLSTRWQDLSDVGSESYWLGQSWCMRVSWRLRYVGIKAVGLFMEASRKVRAGLMTERKLCP